ncbi:hypothetical protein LDENG_00245140 [Lucifuga dentata]|nr:hypothetical protein LDENG_00245140 [Lucifuga dentata]
MTAISVTVQGGVSPQRKQRRPLLELLLRTLIILCTLLSVILSSIAVCDGLWLHTSDRNTFGLWCFCSTEAGNGAGDAALGRDARTAAVMRHKQSDFSARGASGLPSCTTQLGQSGVSGVEVGMGLCRALGSLAVVAAIFSLELQVISQVSAGEDSARRWALGSVLLLLAVSMSASGVLVFVVLLWEFVSPAGFTLTFWCQFTSVFLFLLNGMAARQIHHMKAPQNNLWKC